MSEGGCLYRQKKDKEGTWWSTIFNGPASEKPGILPANVEPNGQVSLREEKQGEG
jgi:hypothetical protein